ncbi:amino acid ABC transporter substrate-binding protein [Sphingomonas sp.]|uniref:amino acid ABC transporter substrate-binding protein n=1 Tax=Sphingomonas sp. TaxID=28214 RepID=UPI0025FDDEED|nr:amino acid ABC transporter substrate-binding protein [Sphingomonas sp.]
MRPLLLVLLLCSGCASADAGETAIARIRRTGVVTIGYREAAIPFSFRDRDGQPAGYSVDLCRRVVDRLRHALAMPAIGIRYTPVTPATRIPLVANGGIDLECGTTTNTPQRARQVAFAYTHFIAGMTFVARADAGLASLGDLRGKIVASNAGSTSIERLYALNRTAGLGLTILTARDVGQGFLLMTTGRAAAFFNDDVVLDALVANAQDGHTYRISAQSLSVEPYAIMLPKGDPQFQRLVDDALQREFASGAAAALYHHWFERLVGPRRINLAMPMSAALRRAFANPAAVSRRSDMPVEQRP